MSKASITSLIGLILLDASGATAQDAAASYSWKDTNGNTNRVWYEGEGFGENRLISHEITFEPVMQGQEKLTVPMHAFYSCATGKVITISEPSKPEPALYEEKPKISPSEMVLMGADVSPLSKWDPYSYFSQPEDQVQIKAVIQKACSLPASETSKAEIITRAASSETVYAMMIKGSSLSGPIKSAWLKEYKVRSIELTPQNLEFKTELVLSDMKAQSLIKHTIDCTKREDRIDSMILYGADGKVISNSTVPSASTPIAPGTVGDTAADFICALG